MLIILVYDLTFFVKTKGNWYGNLSEQIKADHLYYCVF
jgi:hypothetical protein